MKKVIFAILVLVVVGIGVALLTTGSQAPTDQAGGEEAARENFDTLPDLTFEDYNGEEFALADLSGKVAVVNSWATWCPFCVDELPAFGRLQEEYPEQLVVVSINRQESLSRSRSYTDDLNVTDKITFLMDPRDRFYKTIGGFSMPETLIADREGRVVLHKRGPMTFEEMRDIVGPLISDASDNEE